VAKGVIETVDRIEGFKGATGGRLIKGSGALTHRLRREKTPQTREKKMRWKSLGGGEEIQVDRGAGKKYQERRKFHQNGL